MQISRPLLFVAASVLFCCTSAHASLSTTTSISAQQGSQANHLDQDSGIGHSGLQYSSGPVMTVVSADASYGSVKALAAAQSSGSSNISLGSSASFVDSLIFDRPSSVTSDTFSLTVAYYVAFSASYKVSGPAGGYSNGSIAFDGVLGNLHGSVIDYGQDGLTSPSYYYSQDDRGKITTRPGGPSWIYLTNTFRWGSAVNVGLGVQLGGSAASPFADAVLAYTMDAAHSGYWGGIVDVTADGLHLTDYGLRSASGTDYSKSFAPTPASNEVPEPDALLLSLVGMLGLAGVRKRPAR